MLSLSKIKLHHKKPPLSAKINVLIAHICAMVLEKNLCSHPVKATHPVKILPGKIPLLLRKSYTALY